MGGGEATIADVVAAPESDVQAAIAATELGGIGASVLQKGRLTRFVRQLYTVSGLRVPSLGAPLPLAAASAI